MSAWRPFLRNHSWRLTAKAVSVRMPARWWWLWARSLWRTRKALRLRRSLYGPYLVIARQAAVTELGFSVERARRVRRFGSEVEAHASEARSFNAGLALNRMRCQEQLRKLRPKLIEAISVYETGKPVPFLDLGDGVIQLTDS